MPDGMLSALAALHRGHDGPLPVALAEAARNGGATRCAALRSLAESRHIDRRAAACRIALVRTARHRHGNDALLQEFAMIRAAGLALRTATDPA